MCVCGVLQKSLLVVATVAQAGADVDARAFVGAVEIQRVTRQPPALKAL